MDIGRSTRGSTLSCISKPAHRLDQPHRQARAKKKRKKAAKKKKQGSEKKARERLPMTQQSISILVRIRLSMRLYPIVDVRLYPDCRCSIVDVRCAMLCPSWEYWIIAICDNSVPRSRGVSAPREPFVIRVFAWFREYSPCSLVQIRLYLAPFPHE